MWIMCVHLSSSAEKCHHFFQIFSVVFHKNKKNWKNDDTSTQIMTDVHTQFMIKLGKTGIQAGFF